MRRAPHDDLWGDRVIRGRHVTHDETEWGALLTMTNEETVWGEVVTMTLEETVWGEVVTMTHEETVWGEVVMMTTPKMLVNLRTKLHIVYYEIDRVDDFFI